MQLALREPAPPRAASGFSLVEVLCVAGLAAGLALLLAQGWADRSPARPLASAQTQLSSALTAARLAARASGHRSRMLVGAEPAQPERFLRLVVVEVATEPGTSPSGWRLVQRFTLPAGAYVVPASLAGLVADEREWRRPSDADAPLVSDLLNGQSVTASVGGEAAARWHGVAFSAFGTVAPLAGGLPPKGALLVSAGRTVSRAGLSPGDAPVQLIRPEAVRGVVVSAYGMFSYVFSRDAL